MVHTLETGAAAVWIRRALVPSLNRRDLDILFGTISVAWPLLRQWTRRKSGVTSRSGHFWQTKFARPRGDRSALDARQECPAENLERHLQCAVAAAGGCDRAVPDQVALENDAGRHCLHRRQSHRHDVDLSLPVLGGGPFLYHSPAIRSPARAYDLCPGFTGRHVWQYSLSGLPQMLLLFLFNCTVYALVRAVEARYGGGRIGLWLALAGLGFGFWRLPMVSLSGFLWAPSIYSFSSFNRAGWAALIMLAAFGIIYLPWLIRNFASAAIPGGWRSIRFSMAWRTTRLVGCAGLVSISREPFILRPFATRLSPIFSASRAIFSDTSARASWR